MSVRRYKKHNSKIAIYMTNVIFCVAYTILTLSTRAHAVITVSVGTDTANAPEHITTHAVGLNEQRYHYELAKIALRKSNTSQFDEHYQYLTDYPLRPYLDYAIVKKHISSLEIDPIDDFLNTHKGSYLANRLRRQLVQEFAHKKRWKDFIYYYTPDIYSAEFDCQNLYAKVQLGNTDIHEDIAAIWTKGKSHPKACDPLFSWWKDHDGMTDKIIWKRYNAALNKRQSRLARYIKSLLSDEYQDLATLYERVYRNPKLVTHHQKFKDNSPELQDIIAFGIKRYARKNPKDALYHWERYEAQQFFDNLLTQETKHAIVKQLTRKGENNLARELIAQSPSLRRRDLVERLIRDALKNQQWDNVSYGINSLPEKQQNSDRWQYWRARANLELTQATDSDKHKSVKENAYNIYQKLAKNRSFYGFLSSDILNTDYSFENKPIDIPPAAAEAFAAIPGLARSKELWLTGYQSEAQAEWRFSTHEMSSKELAVAGSLAQEWGWYNKGIHAMIAGNLWDNLTVRFPLAYSEHVSSVASTTHVEKNLIYAVARQESAFLETAKSSAGAMGLMQLMPATAKQTAQKSGIAHKATDLLRAEHNIFLGGQYLNELLTKFDGNRILAAAAYNAGPHRVNRWMNEETAALPYDIWIETIPFKETRSYVQNVLSFSVIYSYRLGQPANLVTQLEAKQKL